jgi:ZIP family zinc transporter
MFKSMNRVVLDGMLGLPRCNGSSQFWSLLAPAIEMTGGEGFAKVMPAAFGFSLVPYLFFGIDKVLPIFISILKLAKGSNHHGNEPPCWFRQLHCITF